MATRQKLFDIEKVMILTLSSSISKKDTSHKATNIGPITLMAVLKKAILIATYNKTDELQKVLDHLASCSTFSSYQVVIFYHSEVTKTVAFVTQLNLANLVLVPVDGSARSKLENINSNRIDGLDYCFYTLGVDYVVAIEDDVLCGYDTLVFCEKMIETYRDDEHFRGVNLGSKEVFNEANRFEYGLFRYGLFGQGGAVTKQTWMKIKRLNILNKLTDQGFDFLVEHYYKTGFVIMPRCSRYIDIGWNGTHAPKDPNHQYYQALKLSWVGASAFPIESYRSNCFPFRWRKDCIKYSAIKNFCYFLKFEIYRLKQFIKRLILR